MANSLTTALNKILNYKQTSENWSVFSLYGAAFPTLFFAHYNEYLKKKGVPLVFIDLEERDKADVLAEWSMSFLGQTKVYWCGDIGGLDAATKKFITSSLKSYSGPHTIILYNEQPIADKQHEHVCAIEIPSHVDEASFCELFQLFFPEEKTPHALIKKLFSAQPKMRLDAACSIMGYVLSFDGSHVNESEKSVEKEFLQLLEKSIEPEQSLFVLGQHFFAKERDAFLKIWSAVEADFPSEFWIAYWSEQLWQASLFLAQVQELGPLGARKGVNRLPFSFMQRDWKKCTARELCAAHNFLYSVDYGLKNGYANHGIELFLEHFLQGTFAKK